jgi:hypothetical protein
MKPQMLVYCAWNNWWIAVVVFATSKPEFGSSHEMSTYHVIDNNTALLDPAKAMSRLSNA